MDNKKNSTILLSSEIQKAKNTSTLSLRHDPKFSKIEAGVGNDTIELGGYKTYLVVVVMIFYLKILIGKISGSSAMAMTLLCWLIAGSE